MTIYINIYTDHENQLVGRGIFEEGWEAVQEIADVEMEYHMTVCVYGNKSELLYLHKEAEKVRDQQTEERLRKSKQKLSNVVSLLTYKTKGKI